MNGQPENSENEFLWKLLANPADPSHSYVYNLQLVVNDHPQSGILRALLVPKGDDQHLRHAAPYFHPGTLYKMASNLDSLAAVTDEQIVFVEESTYVPRTYVNPMEEPFVPPIVDDSETNYFHVEDAEAPTAQDEPAETPEAYIDHQISASPASNPVEDEVYEEIVAHDELPSLTETPTLEETGSEPTADIAAVTENEYPWYADSRTEEIPPHEQDIEEEPEAEDGHPWYMGEQEEEVVTEPTQEDATAEEEKPADDNLLAKEYEEHLARVTAANASVPYYTFDEEEEKGEPIDDEVYDEIVSIEDIGLEQLAILNKTATDEPAPQDQNVINELASQPSVQENIADPADDEGKDVAEEIREDIEPETGVNSAETEVSDQDDEENVVQEPLPAHYQQSAEEPVVALAPLAVSAPQRPASERVSRYNDEKMPYSFMWWLDKTRKEHADIYQPYIAGTATGNRSGAKQEVPQSQNIKPVLVDELQQQYFENIFNANSIHGLDPLPQQDKPAEPAQRKEDKIIERFIQEEPQIKHPSTVKLNSENKAKKSSEDRDELVTETLAKIYTEQMLYHKAINTYKKLMLKYPEKSLYFAGQIEQLENKIN